jgi:hypothetical protein
MKELSNKIMQLMNGVHKRLKGGLLLFAVFIMFITSVIIGSIIIAAQFNNRILEQFIYRDDLRNAVESGINIIMADNSLRITQRKEIFQANNLNIINLKLNHNIWGLYYLASSFAEYKEIDYSRIALYGWSYSSDNKIALYLADNEKYLSLSGNTSISGIAYIPPTGVRKANIGSKRFIGEILINGEIKQSFRYLPLIDTFLLTHNYNYLHNENFPESELQIYDPAINEISNSFNKKTLILFSDNKIIVDNIKITGNVILKSNDYILFTHNAIIENIIAYAPKIYFEESFKGSIQAIASDSIIVKNHANLSYPSSLGLINNSYNKSGIKIKAESEVHGIVMIFQDQNNKTFPSTLNIDKNVSIYGQVYCLGITHLGGNIFGTIYTKSFRHSTGSSYYDNFIVDANIDINRLSEHYSGLFLNGISNRKKLIQWLE